MAGSKYTYVRAFEQATTLLPNTFLVVRIDGHHFTQFTAAHHFEKPNDGPGLTLMNAAAKHVMSLYPDIVLAYGQSDEYSFIFKRDTKLWKRREMKLATMMGSQFTSAYMGLWPKVMTGREMTEWPSFDARVVCYPTMENLRDYLCWRQADCHINNLYNTAFWALVQDSNNPHTTTQAQNVLKDTDSALKNELLFSKYNINYAKLPAQYRKGSVLYRKPVEVTETTKEGKEVVRKRKEVVLEHCDIIGDEFWNEHPGVLEGQ
ncbi:Thg1 C terminal domain-containing protein [Gaertneriomyces semiglobifer]|nr:Thg1 C terminal domain-containing protein [Gaertneriomyces semiglobifer]